MGRMLRCGHFSGQKGQNRLGNQFFIVRFVVVFFNYYFWNTGLEKPLSAWSLMNSYGSLEDNAEGDVGCGGVTHEVSESSKDVINNWTMDHLCYILAKNCGRW